METFITKKILVKILTRGNEFPFTLLLFVFNIYLLLIRLVSDPLTLK